MSPASDARLVVVAVVTDEELDVLTDGADDLVAHPHLDVLGPVERTTARRAAERSLAARGVLVAAEDAGDVGAAAAADGVESPGGGTVDGRGQPARVHDHLAPVLDLRRGAPVVVVLHRMPVSGLSTSSGPGTGPGPARGSTSEAEPRAGLLRYIFVLDGVCVVEDVTAAGVHRLSVGALAHVAQWLHEFLIPPDACAPSESRPVTLPGGLEVCRVLRRLGQPVALAEVTVLHPGLTTEQTSARVLFLGPGGCFHTDASSVATGPFHPTSPEELVQMIRAEVEAALAAVEEGASSGGDRSRQEQATMGP